MPQEQTIESIRRIGASFVEPTFEDNVARDQRVVQDETISIAELGII